MGIKINSKRNWLSFSLHFLNKNLLVKAIKQKNCYFKNRRNDSVAKCLGFLNEVILFIIKNNSYTLQ